MARDGAGHKIPGERDFDVAGGPEPELDFASDAKPAKLAARTMIRMTRRINDDYVSKIPDAHTVVSCWTCHRGEAQPAVVPSLPAVDSGF